MFNVLFSHSLPQTDRFRGIDFPQDRRSNYKCLIYLFLSLPDSKHECTERFGKQPNARILRDDDQLCTTEYSRIVPLENGEVQDKILRLCLTRSQAFLL